MWLLCAGVGTLSRGYYITHMAAAALEAVIDDIEEDLVEISEAELASIRAARTRPDSLPSTRGWSSATCACHRNITSCLLSCCCPCAQFGLNQRTAFGESCFKWTFCWLFPLMLLLTIVNSLFPRPSIADELAYDAETVLAMQSAHDTALLWSCPFAVILIGAVGMLRRTKLRQRYGIGGSAVGDFFCHAFCWCCSLAREAREIRRQALDEVVAVAEQDLTSPV